MDIKYIWTPKGATEQVSAVLRGSKRVPNIGELVQFAHCPEATVLARVTDVMTSVGDHFIPSMRDHEDFHVIMVPL